MEFESSNLNATIILDTETSTRFNWVKLNCPFVRQVSWKRLTLLQTWRVFSAIPARQAPEKFALPSRGPGFWLDIKASYLS
jgi:hypothetical protein